MWGDCESPAAAPLHHPADVPHRSENSALGTILVPVNHAPVAGRRGVPVLSDTSASRGFSAPCGVVPSSDEALSVAAEGEDGCWPGVTSVEAWFEADGEAVSWPGVTSADGVPALGVDGSADGVSVPGVTSAEGVTDGSPGVGV